MDVFLVGAVVYESVDNALDPVRFRAMILDILCPSNLF